MKQKITFFLFILLALVSTVNAQSIGRKLISNAGGTLQAGGKKITFTVGTKRHNLGTAKAAIVKGTISTGIVSADVCLGGTFNLPFTATAMNAGNIFTAQLSNAAGSFDNPVNIGTLSATSTGAIQVTIPATTLAGTGYRIRVTSSSPAIISTDNGTNIAINPTIIAITVPEVINTVNASPVDLNSFLPQGTPSNGLWLDINNTGFLNGSYLDPMNKAAGEYIFHYTVLTDTCLTNYIVTVKLDQSFVLGCGTVLVHNAFSPNGDAMNSTFVIDNIDEVTCYPENSVEIFDRQGLLVFSTKNYNNEKNNFNGIARGKNVIKQGTGLPTGTYFYILNYNFYTSKNKIQTKREEGFLYLVN